MWERGVHGVERVGKVDGGAERRGRAEGATGSVDWVEHGGIGGGAVRGKEPRQG